MSGDSLGYGSSEADIPMVDAPDLFDRMAKLDRVCEVQLTSMYEGEVRTGWKVRVVCRDTPAALPIVALGPRLDEVLDEALTKADAMGWLRPDAPKG